MLQEYGVESVGLKIEDRKEIVALEVPFIAQISGDFVIILKLDSNQIEYLWKGKKILSSLNKFLESWTGIVLIAQTSGKSIEPEYLKHKKEELVNHLLTYFLGILFGGWCFLSFILKESYLHWQFICLLFINAVGIYITLLLILKQLRFHSEYADRLCSLFYQTDCNHILDTSAAKFLGIISWSELGLSYFISNIVIVLFLPEYLSYLIFINLLVLPYSIWSVWYQKYVAKQWCVLCLIVQVILWAIALINLWANTFLIPAFKVIDLFYISFIYLLPYTLIALLLPVWTEAQQKTNCIQQMNSMKMREDVFGGILRKQVHYAVDHSNSCILFGNPDAKLRITILSNPHCGPCAKMHKRVNKLLQDWSDKF